MVILDKKPLQDHIAGALFGLAIGDALGADTEGMHPHAIAEKHGYIKDFLRPDQAGTDDTEFTIFYAQLLSQYGTQIKPEQIADHWLKDIYHSSQTYKGAGFSEALAMQNLLNGMKPPASGKHIHSWSDGLAMCAAGFACAHPGDPEKAARLTENIGQVSHAGEGIYGGQVVAAAVAASMTGAGIGELVERALLVIPDDSWTAHSILTGIKIGAASESARESIMPLYDAIACDYYHWADLAPEAVGLAFGLLLAGGGDYVETILAAVNMGRDSDTIAAIVGAILGAGVGYSDLPGKWCEKVERVPGRCIRSVAGASLAETAQLLTDLVGREDSA